MVDREGDAIESVGEWIPSAVLEAVIAEHPRVAAVAVLAEPDERWGERPLAVVQPAGELDVEALYSLLRRAADEGRLARFWVPERIVLVEQIPVTRGQDPQGGAARAVRDDVRSAVAPAAVAVRGAGDAPAYFV